MEGEEIDRGHPRYWSLIKRRRIREGYEKGIVVLEGLISHGRGEALDYILGEVTHPPALRAAKVAAAMLLRADSPVISVNGNAAALAGEQLVELAKVVGAKIEINLFHWSVERAERIRNYLRGLGADEVLLPVGDELVFLEGIRSNRARACRSGIYGADVVLVAIEDGDRTEALVRAGKKVVAIDINPFSRTARAATVTIVDEIERALRNLITFASELKSRDQFVLEEVIRGYDNNSNLQMLISVLRERLERAAGVEVGEVHG